MKRLLVAFTASVLLASCGLSPIDAKFAGVRGATGKGTPEAIQAFQNSLHVYVTQNCSSCHGTTQTPLFGVADVNAAYALSVSYVNFNDPSQSVLVSKTTDFHCGTNVCNTDGLAIQAAIQTWADEELK